MRMSIAAKRALVVVTVAAVGLLGTAGPAAATPNVPYTDPSANGYLGICNQRGQQITSGSIDTVPFAWVVVSSAAAPSSVSGSGRTATLYAYQPIEGLEAGDWSGEQIVGTSLYSNPAHPMVVSTDRDFSLAQFLDVFHPVWDGFVELRMILDAPGKESYVTSYAALNLHISGDTWQAEGGGQVDCTAGQAESDEVILPAASSGHGSSGSQASSSPSTGGRQVGRSSSSPGDAAKGNDSSGTGGSPSSGGSAKARPVLAASSSNAAPLVVVAAVALLLMAMAAVIAIRSRRRRVSP